MRSFPRRHALMIVAALALAACGGGNGDTAADVDAPEGSLVVTGTDTLQFEPTELTAQAGDIDITLVCEGGVNHNFVIEETGEEVVACNRGETQTSTVTLEAGTYTFLCTVPGHERTMRGSLTVEG